MLGISQCVHTCAGMCTCVQVCARGCRYEHVCTRVGTWVQVCAGVCTRVCRCEHMGCSGIEGTERRGPAPHLPASPSEGEEEMDASPPPPSAALLSAHSSDSPAPGAGLRSEPGSLRAHLSGTFCCLLCDE